MTCFEEFGQVPTVTQGQRTDFDALKLWVLQQPRKPSRQLVAELYPRLFISYGRIMEWINLIYPPTALVVGTPRPWQEELGASLDAEPCDRKIHCVVDPIGNTGKLWFAKWWLTKHPNLTQMLSIGKRDDLAYAINESCIYFLFDVPRSTSEFLHYSVLERGTMRVNIKKLKDASLQIK